MRTIRYNGFMRVRLSDTDPFLMEEDFETFADEMGKYIADYS